MKRFITLLSLVTLTSFTIVSCTNDKVNTKAPSVEDYEASELTPGEHKTKLEDIAVEFVNYFDPADTRDIVNSFINLSDYLYYGDFPEYYSAMMKDVEHGVKTLSPDAFMSFATRASEDFVIDINDPDFNPLAGKCYTYNDGEWEESNIDSKAIKFVWDDSVASLSWNNSTKWQYDFEDEDVNYVVYIPKSITFVMTINGKECVRIEIDIKVADNSKSINLDVVAQVNGGYEVAVSSAADNRGLEAGAHIKKGGKKLLSSVAVVAINDFTDIDNWLCEYEEFGDTYVYIDPSEYFVENVKSGAVQLDVLNVSFIAQGDFKNMYHKVEELDDIYGNDGYYDDEKEKKYYNEVCDLINDNVKAVIIYNDTKEKIADVVMQVTSDSYYGYNEYYIEPILLFPDGSKYAFEDYFTERAFGDLFDAIEELAEEFENVMGW